MLAILYSISEGLEEHLGAAPAGPAGRCWTWCPPRPPTAGQHVSIEPDELVIGDVLLVRPGGSGSQPTV